MKRFIIVIVLFLFSYHAFPSLAEVLFNSGLNFYNAGDYDNAIERLSKVFEEYPESYLFPKSCFYLGLIYYEKGEYNLSKKYLLIAMKRSEKGSTLWINTMRTLGIIYYEEGNNEKYEKVFTELSKFSKSKDTFLDKNFYPKEEKTKVTPPEQIKSKNTTKEQVQLNKENLTVTNFIFFTNYITNVVLLTNTEGTNFTNTFIYTNYITNFITNYPSYYEGISSNIITNLTEVKDKIDEINKKEEQLEELNRLTDIKNRLLKLSEKALLIQEMLNKKMEVSNK